MSLKSFNFPPGVTLRDVEPPVRTCAQCGAVIWGNESFCQRCIMSEDSDDDSNNSLDD